MWRKWEKKNTINKNLFFIEKCFFEKILWKFAMRQTNFISLLIGIRYSDTSLKCINMYIWPSFEQHQYKPQNINFQPQNKRSIKCNFKLIQLKETAKKIEIHLPTVMKSKEMSNQHVMDKNN